MLTPGEEDVRLEMLYVDQLNQNCVRLVSYYDIVHDEVGGSRKQHKVVRCSNPRQYASDVCKTHDTQELRSKIDQLEAEIGRLGGARILLQE